MKTKPTRTVTNLNHRRYRPIVNMHKEGFSVQDIMIERNERESTVRAVIAEVQRREKL